MDGLFLLGENMEISKEDLDTLLGLIKDDPEFVNQYLGENNYYFSVPQCAKLLNVCANTILYRIRSEKLKAERDADGHWKIKAKDLQLCLQNNTTTEEPETKKKEKAMQSKVSGSYRYDKSTSQNILDFLHNWEKSNVVGFSTKTLTEDFNKVCATKTTEGQMGGILATLTKKKILIRKGRGIYALPEGFKPANQANQTEFAIPAIRLENVESEHTQRSFWEEMKHEERHLVDKFIAKNSKPTEDFVFTIEDLAREYPHSDRKKIAKAVQNMCYNKKLEKGRILGQYVNKATQKSNVEEKQDSRSSLGKNLEDVLKLSISDDLKAKIIKEMMS